MKIVAQHGALNKYNFVLQSYIVRNALYVWGRSIA